MNCRTFEDIAHELVEGVLPADDAAEARAHADACGSCAERLRTAERFVDFLAGPGDEALELHAARTASRRASSAPPAAHPAWPAATQAAPAARQGAPRPAGGLFRPIFAGAAAAAVVGFAFLFLASGRERLAEGAVAELERGDVVLVGEGRELIAEEDARVFVPQGAAGARVRVDEGNVLFRVKPGHAFAVDTPQGVATVLGTSFHVGVSEAGAVRVAVHTGRVRFARKRGEPVELVPGDRLEADSREVRVVTAARILELEEELRLAQDHAQLLESRIESLRAAADDDAVRHRPAPPVPDAVREFFETEEGRRALEEALAAYREQRDAEAGKAMVEWRLAKLRKDLELTDDQVRRLREIFRRSGGDTWRAMLAFQQLPDDAPEADRQSARKSLQETTAQIRAREEQEVRAVLSQSQYEVYRTVEHAPGPR